MFRLNLALAIMWVALIGDFSFIGFLEGLVVVLLILSLTQYSKNQPNYLARVRSLLWFTITFLWDVVTASLSIARTVLTPRLNIKPAVVAIPLSITSDEGITLLANMITLTPGTLSLDVSMEKKVLYVHTYNMDDVELFRQEIKERFEKRVIKVLEQPVAKTG